MTHCRVPPEPSVRTKARNNRETNLIKFRRSDQEERKNNRKVDIAIDNTNSYVVETTPPPDKVRVKKRDLLHFPVGDAASSR
ncbi:hypothetical protein EVAR_42844_1 [Eumeta japonica]|uniref:Uncharacterized protein n=1 Tax=Eumeta variegata TaxID=151549 RepID=A0A4C1WGF6_EUMVA|nr:hypothetical protein EVAR_42844_1 [Eumeta japonica]